MIKVLRKILAFFRLKIYGTDNVFYISTAGNILPEKLSNEDELKLVKNLNFGSETERTEARKELIERNLRLVVFTAQKFENTGSSMEDLVSVGTIGLIKAVGTFNGEKQIKMATYASRCIENEILMFLRKSVKTKREVSFDDPLNQDGDGNELKLADTLGTPQDEVTSSLDQTTEKEILKKVLSNLSYKEMLIMNLRYGLQGQSEMTQKQVADSLGISQSYISRIEKKILSHLKEELIKLS